MSGTGHTSVRSYDFYQEANTTNSNLFADLLIPFIDQGDGVTQFTSQGIIVANDGATDIQISFDGTNVAFTLKSSNVITFDSRRKTKIFIRSTGVNAFRLSAW